MGSQRKVLENTEEVSSLLSLREELFKNTLKIVDLVKERIRLAEEIGKEKNALGLSLRNHEREVEVIEGIPGLGEIEKSVLNMIFELTILNEMDSKPNISINDLANVNSEEIVLSGPVDLLSYSMGLIISSPGFRLLDKVGIPENLAIGIVQRGGHITNTLQPSNTGRISLVNSDGEKIASLENELLRISRDIFTRDARHGYLEAI